jgi:hypothetical protein
MDGMDEENDDNSVPRGISVAATAAAVALVRNP